MDLKAQIIKKDGEKEFVILSYNEYLNIQQKLEDYEDLMDLRKAKAETIKEPGIPFNIIKSKIREVKSKN